jgi:2,4-dienoyl-CoA reductase-like NADH-dependent reductase (Old Yellow Enzyme family)/thioredoxin reductase
MYFQALFSPLQIGPVQIKNRIQITPHELQYMEGGLATDILIDYFVERAKGGAGLLELSQLMIKPSFGVYQADWKFDSARRFPIQNTPDIIPGLRKLTDGVHKFGSKIFMEVSAWTWLYGPVSSMPLDSGLQLRELTTEDISQIEEDFARASKHAKDAGFDGIDLHGTHGAMIEHFYSPATNLRTDRYGGTLENRMRFLFEIVNAVRSVIGDSIALGMRMCADEKIEGGVTPDYAAKMAALFDGKIDFVNVGTGSAGYFEASNQTAHQSEPLYTLPGYGLSPAEEVKKSTKKTKVGAVGRVLDPVMANEVVEKGLADYVGMTRALIADPELPNKAAAGNLEDIRPCIGTLQDCWGRSVAHEWPMRCTVNPAVGREGERGIGKLRSADHFKKILVIGAGPAGLEAARVASQRGHDVVIYESKGAIGGQTNLARLLPGRADVAAISRWYDSQLRKRKNVRIELNKEVPEDARVVQYLVEDEKPDVVIIGTGSTARKDGMQMITHRPVPGWESSNVFSVDDVFSSKISMEGKRVLVADSTTYVIGAGTAEWLARNGAEVVLVTPHPHVSPELSDYNQLVYVLDRLKDSGVRLITLSWLRRINQYEVIVFRISRPQSEESIPTDFVVLHTGRKHNGVQLKHLFQPLVKEIYEIGDCVNAGDTLRGAIESGYQVGSTI